MIDGSGCFSRVRSSIICELLRTNVVDDDHIRNLDQRAQDDDVSHRELSTAAGVAHDYVF